MKMKTIVYAVMLTIAAPAFAQSIVPPPQMPGAAASAPSVIPPVATNSANPAALEAKAAQAAAQPSLPKGLLSVALPDAPKPAKIEVTESDLQVSGAKKVVASSTKKPAKETAKAKEVKLPDDPFSGIMVTPVSDSQLNRFVFPEPVEGIYFSEDAPLPDCPENASPQDICRPVFLNGQRMMLLQLRAGAKGPVQMLAHLHSGRVVTLNLAPHAGPGAVVRVDGAEDGASDTRLQEGRQAIAAAQYGGLMDPMLSTGNTSRERDLELLSSVAAGNIPAGFEAIATSPEPVRFELFDVYQLASWDNGAGRRLHLLQVQAHTDAPVAISPTLFKHETVDALAIDRETITAKEPAMLYMLERVGGAE